MLKIGILGGTFDPIHDGHIKIAQTAKEELELDQIWLMPTSISPFKIGKKTASAIDRLKMCELAIQDLEGFEVSTIEIFKDEPSYTFDTMEQLTKKNADHSYYFIIGADQAQSLDKWYRIDDLLKIVNLVAFKREGSIIPKSYELIEINNDLIDVSSTAEKQIGFSHLNQDVKNYIMENHLYEK